MSDPALILPLAAEQATLEQAGGKGANLALLARRNYPVPAGFIISTHAYLSLIHI